MVLEPIGSGGIVTATSEEAGRIGLVAGATIDRTALADALAAAGVALNGADALWYLGIEEQEAVRREHASREDADGIVVRRLGTDDADLFRAFEAAAPESDLDEAFVELDHWLVVGALVDGRLACAASAYPWSGTTLADLGVITLPERRGRGLARRTVRALAAHALDLGHEPQYRCQLDNAASMALAASAGLERFATWDVVAED
ncbi:GNAT family N-acetyltransferase [Agrococcus sp. SGAir0287]|nr:GNAT family N-acetyltransferase [Agrococcus sp. SGAir0287]